MAFTHQEDEDNARLLRETKEQLGVRDRKIEDLTTRVESLERFRDWHLYELYPWLVSLQLFVGFGTPPPTRPD